MVQRPPRAAVRCDLRGYNHHSQRHFKETKAMTKHIAIYVRVSTNGQDTKSQEPDLKPGSKPTPTIPP